MARQCAVAGPRTNRQFNFRTGCRCQLRTERDEQLQTALHAEQVAPNSRGVPAAITIRPVLADENHSRGLVQAIEQLAGSRMSTCRTFESGGIR